MIDPDRDFFVLDTNVLVDYPDIIPTKEGETRVFDDPVVDMTDSHIVIPSAVIRELSSFKNEISKRGQASRVVLRRLRALTENKVHGMDVNYHMEAPIELPDGRLLSILPVHAEFKKKLPFRIIKQTDDYVVYRFEMESEADNVEFLTINDSAGTVMVNRIVLNNKTIVD